MMDQHRLTPVILLVQEYNSVLADQALEVGLDKVCTGATNRTPKTDIPSCPLWLPHSTLPISFSTPPHTLLPFYIPGLTYSSGPASTFCPH